MSTSVWTARSLKQPPVSRASDPRTNHHRRSVRTAVVRAIGGWTSMVRNALTRHTRARPIRMLVCVEKVPARKLASATWGGRSWRIRHGLLVDFQITTATGTAERDVVPHLIDGARVRGFHPRTLGA